MTHCRGHRAYGQREEGEERETEEEREWKEMEMEEAEVVAGQPEECWVAVLHRDSPGVLDSPVSEELLNWQSDGGLDTH